MSDEFIEVAFFDFDNLEEVSEFFENGISYYFDSLEVEFGAKKFVCTEFELQNFVKIGLYIQDFLENPHKEIEYSGDIKIISGQKTQQDLLNAISWLASISKKF